MQVACPSCSAEYPVDERRLPASGLKMRCPKCGARFHVHSDGRVEDAGAAAPAVPKPGRPAIPKPNKPPAGAFGDDLDLPAPRAKKPPPSDLGLDLPAPRAAKKKPIAPPVPPPSSLDDGLDLPAPRAAKKKPIAPPVPPPSSLDDGLDLPAPRAAKKKPIAPPIPDLDDGLDLPAPRGATPRGASDFDLDLPAPRGAKRKPIAPPVDDGLDLPAPKGGGAGAGGFDDLDLPAPRGGGGAAGFDDLDLPAPRAGGDFDLDLPAPADGGVDLPTPRTTPKPALANEGTPFDDLDLPAAKSAADLPMLKGFDDVDLPQPKSVLEQADEAFGDLDLPMPKSSGGDSFGDLDLPVPKTAADLPIPKRDDASFGDLDLGGDSGGFGDLDLPTPRDITDLPQTADGGADLPAAHGSMDLPQPKGGGDDFDDLALPEPRSFRPGPGADHAASGADFSGGAELGGPDLGGDITRGEVGGTGYGELDLGPGVDADDMEFADLPQAEGDTRDSLPPPRVAIASKKAKKKADKPRQKSRALLIAGVLVALVLGGGAALGLTPYGLFGINLLEPFMPGAGDPAQVQAAIQRAEQTAQSDRWVDLRAALAELGAARREAGLNEQMLARSLLHDGLFRARFGDTTTSGHAPAIRQRMQEREMTSPEAALGFAADALGSGNLAGARTQLGRALSRSGSDPYVSLVSGELELAQGELEAAEAAFQHAAENGAGARGLWGLARVSLRGEDRAAAMQAVETVLEASPEHGEALAARASLLREAGRLDEALEVAQRAAGASEEPLRTSPTARADAWTLIGEIHEARGRQTAALEAYEGALAAIDTHVPALLGAGRVLLADRPSDALPRFESVEQAEGAAAVLLPNGRNALQEAQLGAARAHLALGSVQEAKATLDALAAEREDDATVLLWLGKAELGLDPPNYAAAEQQFRAAVQADAELFEAYLALAELFLATDRGSDVGAILEQAENRVEETADMRFQLGSFHLRRNEHAAAIRELRRALELDDSLPGALFSLGVAQRRSGRLDAAASTFDRLAEIDNAFPGLSLERGLLFEARGESERAVAAYEAALAENEDDLDLLLRLGAAQVAADRIDDAEETLERVREARPNSAEANHFVGRVAFARGQYAEALNHFRRAIQLDPARGEFHLYVGWAALENNQLGEALRGVDDAIERDPSLGDAFWIRGAIKLRSGRPSDALEDLERALQLRPSRYEIYAEMGEVYDQMGRRRQAIEAYQTAVSHVDDNGRWFYRLGRFRMDAGNTREAAEALQRATLLGDAQDPLPGWLADAHRIRGDALRLTGSARESIPHYRRYLELAPSGAVDRRDVRQRLMDLGEVPPD